MNPSVGLCSACTHARTVTSGKGSTFWLCGLAATDSRFRKYPPLPVLRCPGFEPTHPTTRDTVRPPTTP